MLKLYKLFYAYKLTYIDFNNFW